MAELGVPVVFDGTHWQLPEGRGHAPRPAAVCRSLVRAAAAVGIDGVFSRRTEPAKAFSDGANSLALDELAGVLTSFKAVHEHAHGG